MLFFVSAPLSDMRGFIGMLNRKWVEYARCFMLLKQRNKALLSDSYFSLFSGF